MIDPYFQKDDITIYHGDCLEIMPQLQSVDLIPTDPPYGVGINYKSYDGDLVRTTDLVMRFLKIALSRSRIVAFPAGKWETELKLYQAYPPKWRMCWYKGAQSTASPIGFNDWEAILIYGDKVHCDAHDYFYALPEKMGTFGHPCPKPVQFCSILIGRLSLVDQTILDPFLGSGTMLVAAKQLNRKAIGIEIEEKYCEIAAKRIDAIHFANTHSEYEKEGFFF